MPTKPTHSAAAFASAAAADRAANELLCRGHDPGGVVVLVSNPAEPWPEGGAVADVPGVGKVASGPGPGTGVLNAVGGAGAAGLTGALVGLGLGEAEAVFCEAALAAGRCVVVAGAGGPCDPAVVIARHGGYTRAVVEATRPS
ncbi:hypothetical protein [Gemmata sp.]|uniref:hypothetical protein n=1 Tax=Gemmata sp. TaxID=1914242 RepID=UPI003F72EBF2